MTALPVEAVLVVFYGPEAHHVTYGRGPSGGGYTKDYIQLRRTPEFMDWLGRHFPFVSPSRVVFCGDKGILNAEYLIDDNPRQLRRFRGEGILYSAPHNVACAEFRRVEDWLAVERMFLG